jgi:hypothetical protein
MDALSYSKLMVATSLLKPSLISNVTGAYYLNKGNVMDIKVIKTEQQHQGI